MKKQTKKKPPKGWTPKRIKGVIEHYKKLSDEAQAAEDEAAFSSRKHTVMVIPNEYVPAVCRLLTKKRSP